MKGWLQRLTYLLQFNRPKSIQGQVMTLMILLLVVMLIFVLATFEIGDTSIRATRLANAADQAALELATNLSTRGRMMTESLPCNDADYECCQKKAFWTIIIACVVFIFCPLLTPVGAMIGNYLDGNPQSWY